MCERRQKDRGRQEMDGFDTRSRSFSSAALSLSFGGVSAVICQRALGREKQGGEGGQWEEG